MNLEENSTYQDDENIHQNDEVISDSEIIDHHDEKNDDDKSEFDTLVLSGGSAKVLILLGSLQYCYDNYLLNNLKIFIGTSAGAILLFLLIIGYTPIEIMVYICTRRLLETMQHFNIVAMSNGDGASSFASIHAELEKLTINKIGFLPTMQDLKDKFNAHLICVTYNITDDITEYLSYENYPHLPCLIAIKMSSNLPFIFENFKYGSKYYIDGGISDNFAIDLGDKLGNKILGLTITTTIDNFSLQEKSILEYFYKLIFIPVNKTIQNKIDQVSDKCKVIKLINERISFFNFNINSVEKLELFSEGYQQTKKSFES